MSSKKLYKFLAVFLPVSALSIAFSLRFFADFSLQKFSEKTGGIIICVFCGIVVVGILAMAFLADRMREKYYADERYWQPAVLNLPTDCESVDFLKNKLRQQDFTTFNVRQGEQWYDYTVVYCKKYKYIEPVCLTFIDGDKSQEDYNIYLQTLSKSIRENSACKEMEIYETSILIPIIYTNNSNSFKGLTKQTSYYGGFRVFPCIADVSSKQLLVTKASVYGGRSRTKKTNMIAVNVISGILNSTDNAL